MLQFNPKNRVSAEELLKEPIFDKIRMVDLENSRGSPIKLKIDEESSFDYGSYNSNDLQFKLNDC